MPAQTDLLEALPAAVYTTDTEGRITFYNRAAADLWGHRPELGVSQWCGSWRLYWPDGRHMPHSECPMAVALREGRPIRGVEAIAERPDGTRVRFMPYPTPLRNGSGRLTGAINLLVDRTDQEEARIVSARLAAIVASSDDAIVSKTLEGRITSWNEGATRIFGYDADEMIGQPIIRIIPPELHGEEKSILAKLRRGEHVHHYESVRVAKDGHRVEISLSVSPLRSSSGEIVGASKVARDISDRKQAERSQQLLVEELNHRVKNTLATVQAIANLSSRRARGLGEFVSSFTGRVQALAKAHTLLTRARMEGAEITSLVREQVLLDDVGDGRVTCSGPTLLVGAQSTVHLAMVLHELATNARKYGALSVADGRLSIVWELRAEAGRILLMHWEERGAPTVSVPKGQGFGTTLIEQSLRGHGGAVSMRYLADGVTAEIRLPLPELDLPAAGSQTRVATVTPGMTSARHPDRRRGLAGKRIVVIEDEPLIALDVEAILAAAGCEVVGTAGTLEEARQLIAAAEYDAALVDGNLAGHAVDDLAVALTQRNIPFAFITGYGRDFLPNGFREAAVVTKPFLENQLLAAVEAILHKPGAVQLRRKTS